MTTTTKPSLKMVIEAIASRKYVSRGISRHSIAKYLERNFPVPTGSQFDSTLRSVLKSGVAAGLFAFGSSRSRFKLSRHARKAKHAQRRQSRRVAPITSIQSVKRTVLSSIKEMPSIMRHILSFGHCNHNRTVCKEWNCLNKQNEENMLWKMYQSITDENQKIEYIPRNTWVLHATRPKLHAIEKQLGFYGPLRNLEQIGRRYHIARVRMDEELEELMRERFYLTRIVKQRQKERQFRFRVNSNTQILSPQQQERWLRVNAELKYFKEREKNLFNRRRHSVADKILIHPGYENPNKDVSCKLGFNAHVVTLQR